MPASERVPGVVIFHSPASSGKYIGSPGIAVLPGSGEYLAKCDLFGPRSGEFERAHTRVFASSDRGRSWTPRADVPGLFWASIFIHRGDAYLMGTDRHYGATVLRRSSDGGKTWTEAKDADSGLLLADGKYHCAPVPVVIHQGHLWRAMEDAMGTGGWGHQFHAFMMSAPVEADLLRADSWTVSSRLARDPALLGGTFRGWLEGNAVVTPEGKVVNILRVDQPGYQEKAAIIRISYDGRQASFDPKEDFITFPGGAKKFTIRFDTSTKLYWSLVNYVPPRHRDRHPAKTRNTLALTCSKDLRHWDLRAILLYHPDPEKHGFQYVDWLFEGDDIICASRTAYDDGLGGAHNQHDANYLTFHRITDFRRHTTPISLES